MTSQQVLLDYLSERPDDVAWIAEVRSALIRSGVLQSEENPYDVIAEAIKEDKVEFAGIGSIKLKQRSR